MNLHSNKILALAALAAVAVAPAIAGLPAQQGRGAMTAGGDTDTMSITADSVMAATPLFDRMYLEAVNMQLAGNDSAAVALLDSCRRLKPDAAEVYYRLAQQYRDNGADSTANACLEQAARLQPGNDTYQESVAATYIARRDYASATKAYENLYSHHRDRTDILDLLARLYGAQKDYARTLSTIERIEQIDGPSDELTFMKMNVYDQRGDSKNAYRMLKTLTDGHPNEPSYKVMLGNWLMNHDRKDEAYKLFMSALDDDRENAFALNSLYDYYRQSGDTQAADRLRSDILLSSKTDTKTKISMLQQAIREGEQQGGDSTAVLALFDSTMTASPKDADIANMKAMYMKLKNMPEDSVNAAFAHTLSFEPDNVMARVSIIQSAWARKRWDDVIALSQAGTQYNPEDMTFYYFLGLGYFQKDDNDSALDALRRGADEINDKTDPDMASDFYGTMGDILFKKNMPDAAFAAYDSCLQWKPDNPMALNNYAYYLAEQNRDLKRAEQMSRKTIEAEPTNATYLDTYAWILFLEQRYSEAKAYIDRALDNDSDSATGGPSAVVIEHAGDIYSRCGDTKRAAELWQKAIDAGGDKAVLQRKIKGKWKK